MPIIRHASRAPIAGMIAGLIALSISATCDAAPSVMTLVNKEGCLGCHAQTTKLVGPAYRDVAAKYQGQPDAVSVLASSIIKGSTGKWGDMAMPAHPELSETDAKRLAAWVLAGAKQ